MNSQTKKPSILIVDDEASLRDALSFRLTSEGFVVLEAKNGEEGLALALRQHPDLILLDIVMPVVDGITMLKNLREDKWGREVKVIMLSNLNGDGKVADSVIWGTQNYLVKSESGLEDIVAEIHKQLKEIG
ncbi:MAG: response regulator [Candidatus Falkowbacteria bacterium]|nr:response regulator [Candidatus Falkowbacteria bacterium]